VLTDLLVHAKPIDIFVTKDKEQRKFRLSNLSKHSTRNFGGPVHTFDTIITVGTQNVPARVMCLVDGDVVTGGTIEFDLYPDDTMSE